MKKIHDFTLYINALTYVKYMWDLDGNPIEYKLWSEKDLNLNLIISNNLVSKNKHDQMVFS